MEPADGIRVTAPTVVFAAESPSRLDDRVSDALLDLRPGLLIVLESA